MADKKEWSLARKHAFIVSVLRSGTRRYPPKYETLNEAKTEKKINPKTGRLAQHFLCKTCGKDFPSKEIQIDHVRPVVSASSGFSTWDSFIENLYCEKENLQALCVPCHTEKSLSEGASRRVSKSKRKSGE